MRGMRKDATTQQWSTKTTEKATDPSNPGFTEYVNPDPATDDVVSTTAVLYLTVPATGICSGQILLFHRGLMYFGSATGMIERRSMKITLLSELSHYSVFSGAIYTERTALDVNSGSASVQGTGLGINSTPRSVLDFMLAGHIDLDISMDYFTGLINLDGFANYVEVGTTSSTTEAYRRSILRDLTMVDEYFTGTVNGGSLNIRTSDIQKVLNASQSTGSISPDSTNGVKLKATGARQSTDVTPVQGFIAPSTGTSWQVGLPVAGGS